MQSVSDPKAFQFKLWHLFVPIAGIALVISFVLLREQPNRHEACASHLKMIGLTLHSYHDIYGSFPPLYVTDAQGKPLYSWRVLILPWMEQLDLYNQWRLDEPWDSPHNQSLPEPYYWFKCPVRNRQHGSPPYTDYLAVVGPGMAWEEGKCLSLDDFTDKTYNTVMLVEVRGSQIHWAEPVDFDGTASLKLNASKGLSIGSHELGNTNVMLANATVVHLPDTTSEEEIRALLTRDGGENVDWIWDHRFYNPGTGFQHLRWSGESWEGSIYNPFAGIDLPFSIDFDVVEPTNEQRDLALNAAWKAERFINDDAWEQKARLDAAREVIEATDGQSNHSPTDEEVQQLADDMTLKLWGMTYAVDDAAITPYFEYTSAKRFPDKRIRINFSTDLAIDRVTVTE